MTIGSTQKELEKHLKFFNDSLKSNNSFLQTLFDTVPNPMFYKDRKGKYLYCNDAFSKTILGISKEEIEGKSLYDLPDLIPTEYADIYYKMDEELFNNPGVQNYETKVKCADSQVRHYNFYKATFVENDDVLGLVGVMLDITSYKEALEELDNKNKLLSSLSNTDYLTNLGNRRYFENIFSKKLAHLKRTNQEFSFALVDIDFFKDYNDTFGHQRGDEVLAEVASIIQDTLTRENDFCFRLGGEEFGLLFNTNSVEDSFFLMEKLRTKIIDKKIEAANNSISQYLTVSIGLGNILKANRDFTTRDLYNKVDKLLYESKENGRNQTRVKDFI
ncbi:GGDEF domain-containing protein [Halarcobacter bivalviorum]|uniref:diguanylate cyclase n=1 Tax=Halarcobacter bivalviorum TaxID=663364 RepID=A0AAX2ACH5_9BACT|nr:GGDEF domain-containing protein [Halarcobacter bivalviorum]AXH12690.1 PAS sensor-containing diguanylate cyclase [Halarcobacter bivalviorum]RXK10386.1 diguanylate cyclase [Halarcobacter bivalviorum]